MPESLQAPHTAAVLFDLDGTLADTAPDLGAALNRLLAEEQRALLPLAQLRPHVSGGARALLRAGFGLQPEDPAYAGFNARFLAHYATSLCVDTVLFPGVPELLERLEQEGIRCGIVTNKAQRFALPLVRQLGLAARAACVVSGDTAVRPKPHPEPLLFACAALQVAPARTAYVGDDLRDIQAGQAAGLATVTAAYGYLGGDSHYSDWQADAVIAAPADLADILFRRPCTLPRPPA